MNNGLHVGPMAINRQMQLDFTGSRPRSRKLIAGHIDDGQVVRLYEAFGNQRRRAKYGIIGQTDRKVAFVGGDKSAGIKPAANLAHFFSKLSFVHLYPGVLAITD
jgi:hypothetical protein